MLPLAHMGITVTIVQAVENRFTSQVVDYRLLLAASLLPDIIDKPIDYLLLNGSLLSSKVYGHTLLFLLLLGSLGAILWRRRHNFAPMILFIGAAMHDALDVMWLHPGIFLWPLFGWRFVTPVHEAWDGVIQIGVLTISRLVALEIVGGLLLIRFLVIIFLNIGMSSFLKCGKVFLTRTVTQAT